MSENLSSTCNIPILVDVQSIPRLSLYIDFKYANKEYNRRVDVSIGKKYEVVYVADGDLHKVVGILKSISKVYNYKDNISYTADMYIMYNSVMKKDQEYILSLDCSSDFESLVAKIKSSQIRHMKEYYEFGDDPTTTTKTISNGGITYGIVKDCVIEDVCINGNKITAGKVVPMAKLTPATPVKSIPMAELTPAKPIVPSPQSILAPSGSIITGVNGPSTNAANPPKPLPAVVENKNITGGNITSGIISGTTVQGATAGYNKLGHKITLVDATVTDGKLVGGVVIAGTFDPTKAKIEGTTLKGEIDNIIVVNSMVVDATSEGGTIIDPTMTTANVTGNLLLTGDKMITTSGITIGNETYGGVTTNCTIKGGIAVGIVAGRPATLTGDIVTTKSVVHGAIIEGGEVVGGNLLGDGATTINGTVKGGIGSGGIGTGGITTGGILTFNYHGKPVTQQANANGDKTTVSGKDGLVIGEDSVHGIISNLGDGNITPSINEEPIPMPHPIDSTPAPEKPDKFSAPITELLGVIGIYGSDTKTVDIDGNVNIIDKDFKYPWSKDVFGAITVDIMNQVISPSSPDKPTVAETPISDLTGSITVDKPKVNHDLSGTTSISRDVRTHV